jgi:phospholipid/cholesterol/gamma-HCH transport system substrate-binding protein
MPKEHRNDMKLGIFLIAGLLVLVFALYMIGKDQSMFTGNFKLRARFRDVAGLTPGNNVRYSGIQNGTVKSISILDDTTIEVTMSIDKAARAHIRKNSRASIGSEGLMGNKVINIMSGDPTAPLAQDNDLLPTTQHSNLDAMMGTLNQTSDNAAIVSVELVRLVRSINGSPVFQRLLGDTSLPDNLHMTLTNLKAASVRISNAASGMEGLVSNIRHGNGAIGALTADNDTKEKISRAVSNIYAASDRLNSLMTHLDSGATVLQGGMESRQGVLNTLLRDTAFTGQLNRSMSSIETGAAAFSQNMEALKHNFLTRGYFRRLEKKNRKAN